MLLYHLEMDQLLTLNGKYQMFGLSAMVQSATMLTPVLHIQDDDFQDSTKCTSGTC